MDISEGDVFTGSTLAAKMRDGEIHTVDMLVHPTTYNAKDEKKGQGFMRVEVPESTLSSPGMAGAKKNKFEVTAVYTFEENRITIKPRA